MIAGSCRLEMPLNVLAMTVVFVGFLAGHGLAQLLILSEQPYLVLAGAALIVFS